jgi:oxaloacetate decarboxylase alpha subunit
VNAPLAGTVVKVLVQPGQAVVEGESIIILEAMKMETSISAPNAGTIVAVKVQSGDSCAVGDLLVTLA